MDGQDWKNVTWAKGGQSSSNQNNTQQVSNKKKLTKKQQQLLDEDFVPQAPPSKMKILISQGRSAKGYNRKQLAGFLNIKEDLIKDWETGKTAPTGLLKGKLQKTLGIKL